MAESDQTPHERNAGVTPGVSRRSFMQTLGVSAAAAGTIGPEGHGAAPGADPASDRGVPVVGPGSVAVTLTINGRARKLEVEPATTLLEALRFDLGLTGTKEVCDRGACGACSVLVDGRLMTSCMMLAVDAEGAAITTIEGLSDGDRLDPVQEAFVRHDALQCGFCTPGLVLAARALLDANPAPTMPEIRRGLSGNICRCGTYTNVFNAVREAAGQPVPVDGAAEGEV